MISHAIVNKASFRLNILQPSQNFRETLLEKKWQSISPSPTFIFKTLVFFFWLFPKLWVRAVTHPPTINQETKPIHLGDFSKKLEGCYWYVSPPFFFLLYIRRSDLIPSPTLDLWTWLELSNQKPAGIVIMITFALILLVIVFVSILYWSNMPPCEWCHPVTWAVANIAHAKVHAWVESDLLQLLLHGWSPVGVDAYR